MLPETTKLTGKILYGIYDLKGFQDHEGHQAMDGSDPSEMRNK